MESPVRSKLDASFTAVLVLCATVITALLVRREFFLPDSRAIRNDAEPVFIEQWQDYLRMGKRVGPENAALQLIEFVDFECPYCSKLHRELRALRERRSEDVALTYVHYPLPFHENAEMAARAVECGGNQGRYEAMVDRVFESQKDFGGKSWAEIARIAGVPDLATFEKCIALTDPLRRVVEGKELGQKLNIPGTPTLIVNGWQLPVPPNPARLEEMLDAVLSGRSPVER